MPVLDKIANLGEGRKLKNLTDLSKLVNTYEPEVEDLSDGELRANTAAFKERVADGESLDDLLPEAFATVREAARRTIGQRHFDVQVMGGAALHQGNIAEMKTGEGKTLVSTLPGYLNALEGKGVHIVTVNDYLAKRDSEWMGGIYRFLGLNVGLIQASMTPQQRRPAYAADITYGTNNEFGFDYLRDNMAMRLEECVQRGYRYAIVDEVDSILIDEARTPLIISGMVADSAKWYQTFARIAPRLSIDEDYEVEEAKYQVAVTEQGVAKVEELLNIENLYDSSNTMLVHHLHNALRAKELYKRDVAYVVQNGEVKIVDEFTGRVLEGRRYSEGLHQAIEAKEGVRIKEENQTLATITIQNYFKMYDKLSGMTGTAKTQLTEFEETYKIGVVEIPTNRQMIRDDKQDLIYKSEDEKWDAVADDIIQRNERGQPILVGTVSIEKSERLSALLRKRGIKHVVLNAKYHAQEAEIVAQAGKKNTVTIATNMAGRGTDILLGGNPEHMARQQALSEEVAEKLPKGEEKFVDDEEFVYYFHVDGFYRVPRADWERIFSHFSRVTGAEHEDVVDLGGLHILGTERHEARRIDNQLRGRAGRQGDPGSSRFYLSLEDDLMRIFGSERISGLMQRLGMEEGVPIEHGMVSRAIERAQKQVEAQNFSVRKHLLEYDDVMNKQRESIYTLRREVLEGKIHLSEEEVVDTRAYLLALAEDLLDEQVERFAGKQVDVEEWDIEALNREVNRIFDVEPAQLDALNLDDMNADDIGDALWSAIKANYEAKEKLVGSDLLRRVERDIMLQIVDQQWKDHLYSLDHLKEGIGLRGYGQRDPLVEYKRESFDLFTDMKQRVEEEMVRYVNHLRPVMSEEAPAAPRPVARRAHSQMSLNKAEAASAFGTARAAAPAAMAEASGRQGPVPARTGGDDVIKTVRREEPKVGRNDPCPCGSGKKYKKCHGQAA